MRRVLRLEIGERSGLSLNSQFTTSARTAPPARRAARATARTGTRWCALGAVGCALGAVPGALGAVGCALGALPGALGACIRSLHIRRLLMPSVLGTPQIHNEYFSHNEPHNDPPSVSVWNSS